MDTDKILTRDRIPKEYTWSTEDLYPDDESFLKDLEAFKDIIDEMTKIGEERLDTASRLLKYYQFCDTVYPLSDRITEYAMLNNDVDTTNSRYQDYKSRVDSLMFRYQNASSFVMPQIMALSDDDIERFYEEEPELLDYKIDIDDKRRFKKHTLDEQGEKLVALADELINAPENTFGMLSYADLKFYTIEHNGKEYELSVGSYVALLENPDRELRKKAFKSFYATYESFKNTFASMLDSQVKAMAFRAKARGYASSLEASLFDPNVDTAVYHSLIDTVHSNMNYMYDYVALRKKLLGVDELHMYDVYAPLVPDSKRKIPFSEARDNVISAMSIFGEEYSSVLKSAFDDRWMDIYENKGKKSGAYSSGAYVHPYVLLNQKDNLDSEFTLAHEMGHAMHSYMSNKYLPPRYSNYELFVAEVASTCNETLLMYHLLDKTTDKKERASLINYFLEQFKGTLYRQTMFAEFELKIHEMYAEGTPLTAQTICSEYTKLCKEYFGPDMVTDDEIAVEWARIPHFYYNFYVYQYATGFSAAIALATQIRTEGQPAIDRYLNFLKSGRTKDPVSLLRDAGVDMATPGPVETALRLFGKLIEEMDELCR